MKVSMLSCIAAVGMVAFLSASALAEDMKENEIAGAQACKTFVSAQDVYRRTDWDKNGILEYAKTLKALVQTGDEKVALIDQAFADAEGDEGKPWKGYLFRVLTAQSDAAGKARDFVNANGQMVMGYALLAWPAEYNKTGRNTFMISNAGTVYQADLGEKTDELVDEIKLFDPKQPTWLVTE